MRKLVLPFIVFCLVFSVTGADAVISEDGTGEIELNSSNGYSAERTFDGSGSSPDSASLEWAWVQNRSGDSGETASFEFTRANDQSNTIELKVIDEESDTTSVTRTLRDEPEIVSTPSDATIDLDSQKTFDVGTDGSGDYEVRDEFDDNLSYSWDLDAPDSDDETGTGSSFQHTYSEEGDYDLELNVTDEEGLYSVDSSLAVSVENQSDENEEDNGAGQQQQDGKEDGDGEGFAETSSFGYVEAGSSSKVEFEESPVTGVEVTFSESGSFRDLKSDADEDMDNLPNGVDEEPEGTSYSFIELEKDGFDDDEVDEVSFEYEVEKDWIEDNEIVRDTIDLQRYSDGWSKLGAEEVDEDDEDIYYEADAPGLSVFSITGEEAETSFSVESVEISPGQVDPGENFTVNFTVENAGNIAGEYNLSFELAGESFEETLSLDPGSSETAEFTTSVSENGSYSVEVGDSSASVQVGQVEEQAEEEEQQQEQDEGFGLLIPVVALLIVLSIGAMAFYVFTDSMARQMMIERVEEFFTGEDEEEGALSGDDYSFT